MGAKQRPRRCSLAHTANPARTIDYIQHVRHHVTPRWRPVCRVFVGRFTAPVFTAFLDRMAQQVDRKVHVIDPHSG